MMTVLGSIFDWVCDENGPDSEGFPSDLAFSLLALAIPAFALI